MVLGCSKDETVFLEGEAVESDSVQQTLNQLQGLAISFPSSLVAFLT